MQGTTNPVLFAFIFILTVGNGGEGLLSNILEGFGPTNVARVGIDEEEWLDFRDSCHNPAHCDQPAEIAATDFSNSQRDIAFEGFEVEITDSLGLAR